MNLPRKTERMRLRKGTTSCWECKRRKIRCEYYNAAEDNAACKPCLKRGSRCIGQALPETYSLSLNHELPSDAGPETSNDSATGTPLSAPFTRPLCSKRRALENGALPTGPSNHKKLSRILHESLPSREDTEKICAASRSASNLIYRVSITPYTVCPGVSEPLFDALLDIPGPQSHPVLIARHMLLLAILLQHLNPKLHNAIDGLSEPVCSIVDRLIDYATSFIITNDELLSNIEGLQCLIIDSMFQANVGNLQRSWTSNRRAMSVAQLLGLNRRSNQAQAHFKVLSPKTPYDSQHMWFRIVSLDRYLCLMLGVTQGSLDHSMASESCLGADTPLGRLERIHCVIASQILERNESCSSTHNLDLMRSLDTELQKAAIALPGRWWLPPDFGAAVSDDSQTLFSNTRQLFTQVVHYNILNRLHLPFMLCSLSPEREKYEYSLIACVNASREVLLRFSMLRHFNKTGCECCVVDFFAIMAAITLLLAHLGSHLSEANLLAPQRHSDYAMIEQVQEDIKACNRIESDTLIAQSSETLDRLTAVELTSVEGRPRASERVSVYLPGSAPIASGGADDGATSAHIPYFGVIEITSRNRTRAMSPHATCTRQSQPQKIHASGAHARQPSYADPLVSLNSYPIPASVTSSDTTPLITGAVVRPGTIRLPAEVYGGPQPPLGTLSVPVGTSNDGSTSFATPAQAVMYNPMLQPERHSGLTPGNQDWHFPGTDWSFFNNLGSAALDDANQTADFNAAMSSLHKL